MKRQEIIKKLLKEGFSEKTLVNFTDKQLNTLSSRILGESDVMISKNDPKMSEKIDLAKKEKKSIETYESKDLKGGQKKLDKNHNGKIDSQDFKILNKKKSEVKEEKTDDKFQVIVKYKELEKDGGKFFEKKYTIKASNESEAKKLAKEKWNKTYEDSDFSLHSVKINSNIHENKKLEVSNWVQKLAEQKYHSFTSKNEIMEMIKGKLSEQEVGSKVKRGHNNIPEFMSYDSIKNSDVEVIPAKPKVDPGKKPGRLSPFKDKPSVKPKPKASLGEQNSDVKTVPTKPKVDPGKKPKPASPFREVPKEKTKPKASLGEGNKPNNKKK
jgi:hypothetical protein